ncbi:hypothetical protein B0T14DRAFT_141429 [Immersiella caudata]|uniref:Uncharacterized protein n=1 Tax=Immersiella caudata TaxID=314043 RepID=A0AA39X5G6_9PEZI|nr:hypothetical protein B0T14DRAFT_141429 [Immersiella caudata]
MLARVGNTFPRRTGGSPSSSLGLTAFLVMAMQASVAAAALPYIPTTVIEGADSAFYIFSPNSRSVDLLEVNFSSTLSASSLKPKTLASDLPFLGSSDRAAFTPTVLDNGILAVFAGDCAIATDAALWTYKPGNSGSAAWTKHSTAPSKTWDYGQGGPYFLGGSLSFSAQLAPVVSDPVLYVYGGMCPLSNGTAGTQSSATYSNRMLKLSPPITGDDATSYTVSYAPTAGPPIAEAGFTFTELAPSISNRSGIVTQQTSHVLLGGHTQQAFINMSTAAIWSLPEETWNFVSISTPPTVGAGKNDLLAKDMSDSVLAAATASSIDSRSGHTAVLSEDGTSLIILGGWVGDTNLAAEPQLAVINIGASFSDWQWTVPAAQPRGLGFYGHGAALLPGNVMMVYGGYEITGSSKLRRRAASQMFFNISALTWADTYANPGTPQRGVIPKPGTPGYPGSPSTPKPGSSGGQNEDQEQSSHNNKLPLGLGLGLGIPFLLVVLGLAFCLYRRRARRRAERDETLRGLSQGMNGAALPFNHRTDSGEMLERDENIFPWNAAAAQDWYTGGHDPYVQGRRSLGYETLRGGNGSKGPGGFVPLPPPMARSRGAARGLYQPSTGFGGGGSGDYGALRQPMKNEIHPIYEDDEEEQDAADVPLSPTRDECDDDDDDPFATPTRSTPTTALFPPPSTSSGSNRGDSPERQGGAGGQSQDAEVQGWVSDVDAADAVLTAKISRHGSTTTTPPRLLTAQSHSYQLHPQSAAGRNVPGRRNSNRSSEPDERTNSNLSDRSTFSFVAGSERNVSVLRPPKHRNTNSHENNRLGTAGSSTSGASFSTAKSTFAALQAEGPSLLAGEDVEDEDYVHIPGSPSKSKPRRSWLGSLKRVFSGGTPSDGSSREDSPTRESLLNESGSSDYEPRLVGMGPNGTMLTRRKQGREDEWDIERAVEQRLVQVMFTVPKERLRVVNAEIEKEEEVVVVSPGEEGDTSSLEGPRERRGAGMRSSERLREVTSGERLRASGSRDMEKRGGEDWLGGDERLSRELEGLLGIGDEKFGESLRLGGDLGEQRVVGDQKWSEKHDETDDESLGRNGHAAQEKAEEAAASLLHLRPEAAERERAAQPGLSPSASLRTSSMTTTTLHTAEAVRLERPRTRVLEMVESIESKSSRESTPSGSPTRGK